METTNINLQLYNLTGQVMVMDGIAKFNGNYSSVLLGALNGRYVSIKVIKATSGQQTSTVQRKLLREIVVWGSATHRNVHPFYGFATDPAFGPFGALISPWCRNGDASQNLSRNGPGMVMAARMNLWKGVLEGVVYLHGRTPPIIHGDLKPGNVLIDDAGRPRICDFGLARIFDTVQGAGLTTTSEHTGTTRYLAPELVTSEDSVSPTLSSDMYALGCLGLEFIYLRSPFSHRPNNPRGHLMILQDLRRGLPPVTTPPLHAWPSHRIWSLLSELWALDPLSRPPAFTTAQRVKRTEFTLPLSTIQRIIHFVDADYNLGGRLHRQAWYTRTQRLRSLCLVSRACCAQATPVLYRHLWLPDDITAATLFSLEYALTNSVTFPLSFNQVTGGYGTYSQSLIINGTERQHFRAALSTGLRELLHMMPRLRLVYIGNQRHIPPALHSLTTLKIQYYSRDVLGVNESIIVPAFSYLQRLYIYVTYYTGGEPTLPPASSRLFLPHLRDIQIYIHIDEDSPTISSALFPEAFSGWKLPSLQYLDIFSFDEANYADTLIGFLRSHKAAIRYLTLYYGCNASGISQDLFTTIFPLCTNLRSMQAELNNIPAFDLLPSHPNLEKLSLTYYDDGQDREERDAGIYKGFQSLKSMATTVFPKLVGAEFAEGFSGLNVIFYTENDFITVKETDRVSRHYDGDRVAIDMEARSNEEEKLIIHDQID